MFKEIIEKKNGFFLGEKVRYFLEDWLLDPDNKLAPEVATQEDRFSFAFKDTKTHESIVFESGRISCTKRYLYPTEEHECCFESETLSNLYSDICMGVPMNPRWDIYGEYIWFESVEPGVYECVRKKDKDDKGNNI